MASLNRRTFLKSSLGIAGGLALWQPGRELFAAEPRKKLPIAAVVTEYRKNSHADVIVGKILEGWKQDGGPGPDLELVSLYTDQVPSSDTSRALAAKHGFKITKTIEEALTLGGDQLAVAGVLCIGEHGDYPADKVTGQVMYPRRRFFDEVIATFKKVGKVVPVFNDKHLAWNWENAKQMYDTAREMQIPFLAGSSLPLGWRQPETTWKLGIPMKSALALGYGGLESYGFHAVEGLQCQAERREGGETGVVAVQAVSGAAIKKAGEEGRWSLALMEALKAVTPPTPAGRTAEFSPDAVFYLVEYRDGLQAAVAMGSGVAHEFAFAGQSTEATVAPTSFWYRLQEEAPFGHFAQLLKAIEETIHTGKPAYPVERTLLATGILDAALHSHADGGKRIETPHLAIRYEPVDWPFAEGKVPGA